ncbi:MAG TPA: DUF4070 domain-containing protein [Terracidiphilus sp.]|nr:DUF4070 domain-containing protein [Terracidiphilus sp.]HEV2398051.1 DUF4070 domain-containing protein [Candidatus Sulfotelmatobacter sp.]
MTVQYSRGCPFNCEFCDIIEIYGRRPRTKAVAQVLAELDQLLSAGWRGPVFIVDDNFIGNKIRVRSLLNAMTEWQEARAYPFRFITEASINLADDSHLLQSMKDAGFTSVFLGIETPDECSLKATNKLQNTRRDLLESIALIQRYGIEVMGGFILGFDTDREDIFDRLVEFIQKSAIPIAMVGLLQALPGTQLFRRLSREGRILDDGGGNNTGCELNFLPRMNAARLVAGYRSVLSRIYSSDAYYARVRDYLIRCHPKYRAHINFGNVRALFLSVLRQGIRGRARLSYWKFMFFAATRHRRSFGAAMTMAVMGYHFQTMTERLSGEILNRCSLARIDCGEI